MTRDLAIQPAAAPPTRKSLLLRLKDWRNEESWHEFFRIYERLIHTTALKAGLNNVEAQEVVQETLFSVAKKIAGFDYEPARGSFKGWLMTITRRRILDQLRKRQAERAVGAGGREPVSCEELPDPHESRLEKAWHEEWHQALLAMAQELVKRHVRPGQYQMFDLYVLQQLPMKAVTRKLGVNPARVYMAKYRITRLLSQELKQLKREL